MKAWVPKFGFDPGFEYARVQGERGSNACQFLANSEESVWWLIYLLNKGLNSHEWSRFMLVNRIQSAPLFSA